MNTQSELSVMTQFARMWSANIMLTILKSGGWPGFRYTADEERRMGKIAEGVSDNQLFAFLAINTVVTIIIFPIRCSYDLRVVGGVWG